MFLSTRPSLQQRLLLLGEKLIRAEGVVHSRADIYETMRPVLSSEQHSTAQAVGWVSYKWIRGGEWGWRDGSGFNIYKH